MESVFGLLFGFSNTFTLGIIIDLESLLYLKISLFSKDKSNSELLFISLLYSGILFICISGDCFLGL
jgi:hypothetical protein